MVKSGKLPPLPGNISASMRTVIKAMLSLNVSELGLADLSLCAAPPPRISSTWTR